MEKMSIGKKIANLRKEQGLTQSELAEKLGVSAQAVSKWENDVAYPDITLLPALAEELNTTIDLLLGDAVEAETRYVEKKERKNYEDMIMKIRVKDGGDKVKVNLPMPIFDAILKIGLDNVDIGGKGDSLKEVDFENIKLLVEQGAVGKLVEVESEDGATVEIYVE
ncbi:MAG: helix-turn-helix transcriptional regulator [Clostridiaceae bacterium]|nr:helix-turn-helix transcriptional regulator [Clostridiaceae bacterium]